MSCKIQYLLCLRPHSFSISVQSVLVFKGGENTDGEEENRIQLHIMNMVKFRGDVTHKNIA